MCQQRKFMFVVFLAIVGVTLLAFSSGQGASSSSNPAGTYLLTITFPPMTGVPPFQELLVLHENGTVSETNTTLHANSANPANPQFDFNGSDGYGAWRTGRHDTVALKFVKLVFDGDMNEHVGYLVVDATAAIDGGVFTGQESDVNMLMGTPTSVAAVRAAGSSSRLTATS